MKKLLIGAIILFAMGFICEAQTDENLITYRPKFTKKEATTTVTNIATKETISATNDISVLVNEKLDSIAVRNKKIKFAQGFRIIVYSGSNKDEIKNTREKIYSIYPDIDIYQVYKQPDYKIKVGDYIDRFVAHHALHELKAIFPDALITMEQVNLVRK